MGVVMLSSSQLKNKWKLLPGQETVVYHSVGATPATATLSGAVRREVKTSEILRLPGRGRDFHRYHVHPREDAASGTSSPRSRTI